METASPEPSFFMHCANLSTLLQRGGRNQGRKLRPRLEPVGEIKGKERGKSNRSVVQGGPTEINL